VQFTYLVFIQSRKNLPNSTAGVSICLGYGVDTKIEKLPYVHARWIGGTGFDESLFERREDSRCLEDRDGLPVVLFKTDWGLRYAEETYKTLTFLKSAPATEADSSGV
jgi:peptide chain release factor 3